MSFFSKLLGSKCERCGHRNADDDEFCANCGVSRAFPRPTILNGNRWDPLDDEVAAYFRFRDLKGIFSTNFYVPTGMRAVVLRTDDGNDYQTLKAGEHKADDLFAKLNNFMRASHGEVLVFREDPQALKFSFNDILSADLLPLTTQLTAQVSIANPHAFLRRAMLREGAVTHEALQILLGDAVRQALAETLGRRHIDDMARDDQLREHVRIQLQDRLKPLLDEQGLQLVSISELSLRHEKYDQLRELQGRLWLIRQEQQLHDSHARQLDELYNAREWQAIRQREADLRRRQRLGELQAEEVQLAHTLRMLEVDQYENITQAKNREEAIRLGAAEQLAMLEHQQRHAQLDRERNLGQRAAREQSEDEAWQHTQALARIRHETEQEIERISASERTSLARARANNALDELQFNQSLARAATIDKEEERKQVQAAHLDGLVAIQRRAKELAEARHKADLEDIGLQQAVRRREALRVQALEDARMAKQIADLAAEAKRTENQQGLSELERMSALQLGRRAEKMRQHLESQRTQFDMQEEALDSALKRELDRKAQDAAHQLQMRASDVEYLRALSNAPETALIAQADTDTKIAALVQLGKLKVFSTMTEGQIRASEGSSTPQAATPAPQFASNLPPPTPQGKTVAEVYEEQAGKVREDYQGFIATLTSQNDKAAANLLRAIELALRQSPPAGAPAYGMAPPPPPYQQPYQQPYPQGPYGQPYATGYAPHPQGPMGAPPSGLYSQPPAAPGFGMPGGPTVYASTHVYTGGAAQPAGPVPPQETVRTVAVKQCLNPHCRAENLASAPRCAHCGSPF